MIAMSYAFFFPSKKQQQQQRHCFSDVSLTYLYCCMCCLVIRAFQSFGIFQVYYDPNFVHHENDFNFNTVTTKTRQESENLSFKKKLLKLKQPKLLPSATCRDLNCIKNIVKLIEKKNINIMKLFVKQPIDNGKLLYNESVLLKKCTYVSFLKAFLAFQNDKCQNNQDIQIEKATLAGEENREICKLSLLIMIQV